MFFGNIINGLISDTVGNFLVNKDEDVKHIKSKLARLDLFDNKTEPEPHGIITRSMDDAIKVFQKDNGLRVDGYIYPKGDTENALIKASRSHFSRKYGNCDELEVAWVNAGAELFMAQQNLEIVESEKSFLEQNLSGKESELSKLEVIIKKELGDKIIAKSKGAAVVGSIGAILGSRGGLGSSMSLGQVGMGVGTQVGKLLEEAGDAISSKSETVFSLDRKKQNLLNEIEKIKEKLENIIGRINNILKPEVGKKQQAENTSKDALIECKNSK